MKFRSPSDRKIRLASTSGHVVLVGPEFKDVPDVLERDAISSGCITEEMFSKLRKEFAGQVPDEARPAVVIGTITSMISNGDKADFTTEGLPNLSKLSSKCGFTVSRDAMTEAWDAVNKQ